MTNEDKIISALKHIPIDQIQSLDYFRNRGSRFIERALIDDSQGRRERAFSDTIKAFHELRDDGGMCVIVGHDPIALEACFTTFQWLTTNVGREILREALNATGRDITDVRK